MVECLVAHVAGKTLLQPEIIPPLGRHQIAKPLVGQLMSNDLSHILHMLRRRGQLLILWHQQCRVTERDQTPVLHGAESKVRHRDKINLGQFVLDAEIILVVGQELAHHFVGIVCHLHERRLCPDLHVRREAAVQAAIGGVLHVGDNERQQICGHFGRGHEIIALVARTFSAEEGESTLDLILTRNSNKFAHLKRDWGILESVMFILFSVIMLTVKLAFMSGRSKQGKARRASMGENCVEITQLQQKEREED